MLARHLLSAPGNLPAGRRVAPKSDRLLDRASGLAGAPPRPRRNAPGMATEARPEASRVKGKSERFWLPPETHAPPHRAPPSSAIRQDTPRRMLHLGQPRWPFGMPPRPPRG